MYDVSIQELNNLIGELDSFQREHEMKMRQRNGTATTTAATTTTTTTSIKTSSPALPSAELSDIYSNLDRLSICSSNEANPIMSSTQSVHSNESTFNSDCVDAPSIESLSLNGNHTPITTKSDTINSNGPNENGKRMARNIELIRDSHNVTDNYVKEHSEIVVLRRKDSLTDLNETNNGAEKEPLERVSSFRCSSFSKPDRDSSSSFGRSNGQPLHRQQSNGSGHNDESVILANDEGNINTTSSSSSSHATAMNGDTQLRSAKPLVTPRPASLSGLCHRIICYSFIPFTKFKKKSFSLSLSQHIS